ncbi:MAG: hypothetical protein ACLFU6_04700 [Candidatus Hydrogenedentota bacterium]
MPIHRRTYRSYEGDIRRHFRWAIITAQDLRVLFKFRIFYLLLILAGFHLFFRVLQVVSYNIAMQEPNSMVAMLVREINLLAVDNALFLGFLRIQWLLVFLAILFAGSGAICNDVRNNLMEVLFAKPLSWRDYALGKFMTLAGLGLALTLVPVLALILLHNLMAPSWDTLNESVAWIWPSVALSLLYVVPAALAVLAASALLPQQNYAGACVVALVMLSGAMQRMVSALAEADRLWTGYYALSLPTAINHLGERLFGQPLEYGLTAAQALAPVLAVTLAAGALYMWRVRRCEVLR